MEGLRSRLLMCRFSPESMRDDLENINMLLFRFVGNGFQLALCNVSCLETWESAVLVPDPIVFVVRAARPSRSLRKLSRRHALWCVSFVPRPTTSPLEGRSRRDNEGLNAPGVGVGGQPEEQSRGTRDQPRHHQAAVRRRWRAQERRFMVLTIQSFFVVSKCVFIA